MLSRSLGRLFNKQDCSKSIFSQYKTLLHYELLYSGAHTVIGYYIITLCAPDFITLRVDYYVMNIYYVKSRLLLYEHFLRFSYNVKSVITL